MNVKKPKNTYLWDACRLGVQPECSRVLKKLGICNSVLPDFRWIRSALGCFAFTLRWQTAATCFCNSCITFNAVFTKTWLFFFGGLGCGLIHHCYVRIPHVRSSIADRGKQTLSHLLKQICGEDVKADILNCKNGSSGKKQQRSSERAPGRVEALTHMHFYVNI